ncbi:MAG: hypothetical protein HKN62_05630 [Phycisphaerales bacterium]|nr:hypothetical protein [Phycisphaerales bacterium]
MVDERPRPTSNRADPEHTLRGGGQSLVASLIAEIDDVCGETRAPASTSHARSATPTPAARETPAAAAAPDASVTTPASAEASDAQTTRGPEDVEAPDLAEVAVEPPSVPPAPDEPFGDSAVAEPASDAELDLGDFEAVPVEDVLGGLDDETDEPAPAANAAASPETETAEAIAPEPDSPAPLPERGQAIDALDDVIAGDVEELLQGDFTTVSVVLAEDQGAAAEMAVPDDAHAPVIESAEERPVELPARAETGPAEAEDETPAEPVAIDASDAATADAAEATAPGPDPDADAEASMLLPERGDGSRPDVEPTPAEPAAPVLDDPAPPPPVVVVTTPTPPPAPPRAPSVPRWQGWWARSGEPTVLTILALVNWPVRLLPSPVRPFVDWIALSLLFWVPVVWAIAWFMVGA